jgi:hypothetical protein
MARVLSEVKATIVALWEEEGIHDIGPVLEAYLFSANRSSLDELGEQLTAIKGRTFTKDQVRYRLAQVIYSWYIALRQFVSRHKRMIRNAGGDPEKCNDNIELIFGGGATRTLRKVLAVAD